MQREVQTLSGRQYRVHARFDSVSELVKFANGKTCNHPANIGDLRRFQTHENHGVTLMAVPDMFANPPEYLKKAFEDGRKRLEHLIEVPTVNSRRRKSRLEEGDELDPVSWVRREVDGWSDVLREPKAKRVIRIGVNVSLNASDSYERVMWRGIGACVLADLFTANGQDVEVVLFSHSIHTDTTGNESTLMECTIKPSDAPLDSMALILPCCEVGFTRTVIWSARMRVLEAEVASGLGQAVSMPSDLRTGCDYIFDRDITSINAAEAMLTAIRQKEQLA